MAEGHALIGVGLKPAARLAQVEGSGNNPIGMFNVRKFEGSDSLSDTGRSSQWMIDKQARCHSCHHISCLPSPNTIADLVRAAEFIEERVKWQTVDPEKCYVLKGNEIFSLTRPLS